MQLFVYIYIKNKVFHTVVSTKETKHVIKSQNVHWQSNICCHQPLLVSETPCLKLQITVTQKNYEF